MKLWLVVEKGKAEDYKKREKKRRKIIVFVSEFSLGMLIGKVENFFFFPKIYRMKKVLY